MKKTISLLLALVLIVGAFAGCANKEQEAEITEPQSEKVEETTVNEEEKPQEVEEVVSNYPVTIENNGITATYESAPERVVAVEYPVAEILVALGLGDKVVALAPSMNTIDEVMPELRDEVAEIPLFPDGGMNNGTPTLEAILATEPDFVYGTMYSFFPQNCGTAEDYKANNINIYATEGTCVEKPTLENLYHDITNLGMIFDVRERADELIAELREREENVKKAVEGLDAKSVFVLDMDMGNGTYMTTGGATLEDYMIALAGGKNVFDEVGKQYANAAVEEIISKNAEYIIVTNYYTADDGQIKVDRMKNSPDFKDLTAVQNDNFLILSGLAVWPSLQSLDALEAMAEFLHPEAFN